jgi:hypothetical protein
MLSIPDHVDNKFTLFKIVVIMTAIVAKYIDKLTELCDSALVAC